ncbi:DUF262 domain-containing protein [Candidatus Ruminimicrobium bovinum]|uniref:GmrSD restriction endonuclease domain-containing protein n=1 Tax=Candidatus Ruminimicrobium bovinum TaxID=3242779 RepID=UPI0039B93E57
MKKTTFWEILKENKIEIPIIQRDYAQGREGKEHLRERFIKELVKVLINKEEKSLELDFVYGSNESNKFIPLDGQQRLTTLWLLHWYIAYKSENLRNNKDIFINFTYETRVSSREFCKEMSEQELKFNNDEEKKISDTIEKQTWFYNIWKQDPTINSMLRTLDTIEQVLTKEQVLYKELWEVLTKDNKISFIFYDMKNFGLSDDLYIKMNARFKPLTNFENFKADLINHLKNKNNIDINEISKNLDTNWTDIFWKNREERTNEIDDIFFTFLNRYFFVMYIEKKLKEQNEKKLEEKDEYKKFLNLCVIDKKDIIEYTSFDIYENIIDKDTLEKLQKIFDIYNKIEDFETIVEYPFKNNEKINEEVDDEKQGDFSFIPRYKENFKNNEQKVIRITQRQRMVFFGIIKFLTNFKFSEDTKEEWKKEFKRWLRFVWNLADDVSFRTEDQVMNVIEKINEVFAKWQSENSKISIYEYLKEQLNNYKFENSSLDERFKEECEKAKRICNDEKWEKKIIEAEQFSFFRGTIRFLFRDEKGNINWDFFDKKNEQVKKYFDKKNDFSPEFWKNFIYWTCYENKEIFNDFTFILNNIKNANSTKPSWKYNYLIEKRLSLPIHKMLIDDLEIDEEKRKSIDKNTIQYYLCNTNLIDNLIKNKHFDMHRFIEIDLLYPKNVTYGINLNLNRQKLLNKLYEDFDFKFIDIEKNKEDEFKKTKVLETNDDKIKYFFYGWFVYFKYKGFSFKFGSKYDNNIYDYGNDNEKPIYEIEITDNNIGKENIVEEIKRKLDNHINTKEPIKSM